MKALSQDATRDREREARRLAILRAARQLFVSQGYANVSMRRIAERIDYSPAAIYLHFAGKADILDALAEEGFGRFARAMAAPWRDEDALAALEERLWRYYEFSKRQPEYFWLLFVDRSAHRSTAGWDAEGAGMVQRCVDAGLFPRGTSPVGAFRVLATAIHGAAVLRLCGRRVRDRRDADALARDTLRAALAGLRAGVALDSRREN